MGLRKALSYSKKKSRPYTRRSKVKNRNYIKAAPTQKIVKFKMGNIKAYEENKLPFFVRLLAGENILIRDNALEAARQQVHRNLDKAIPGQYYFEVRVFPHQILRENKSLTGAGADRMQTGMAHSFGAAVNRAAFVKKEQEIFLLALTTEKGRKMAIEEVGKIKAKLPCHSRIAVSGL